MPIQIEPVGGRRELAAFIDLPYRLHRNHPQWVPPLRLERRLFLSPRFNPFFKHGEAQLFLARRDREVVGRISAHIDHAYNRYHRSHWGWFGFFECVEDGEVAKELLEAAAGWLEQRGCELMVGPADFTMNDESGILVDGFSAPPLIREPWHPPYYQRLVEGAGLEKAVDLYVWRIHADDYQRTHPMIFKLAERLEADHGIVVRRMSRLHLRKELDRFAEVYNAAWAKNWGFVPYSKEDLDAFVFDIQLVFDRDWMMVAEKKETGEPVAIAMTFPDINQVLRRMNGRLLPWGWYHYLRRNRIMTWIRVGFLGVKPEYQHTGVAAKLYVEHFETARRKPHKDGHCGWILETNLAMNRAMAAMGSEIAKTYRMYQRPLSGESRRSGA